uniref:inverted formin-2 isoform X7 n=1 Tax=Myxine glutinosa TaxID=7769 RepID=UPI00358FB291
MVTHSSWSRVAKALSLGQHEESDWSLENAEPELCVHFLSIPSSQNYSGLRQRLMSANGRWMQKFLDLNGLDMLLEALSRLTVRNGVGIGIYDAYTQLECVGCVRAILNSQEGLEHLVCRKKDTRRLFLALDTTNELVKRQVFELFSALCVFSNEGHALTLDALDHYKVSRNQHSRFSVVLSELKTDQVVQYQDTLLGFLNAVILGTNSLKGRLQIRNELFALDLLECLNTLRHEDNEDILIQCDTFTDCKEEDELELVQIYGETDFYSHEQLFSAIFDKVKNSPIAATLLSILQNFYELESHLPGSANFWNALDLLSQRAAILASEDLEEDDVEVLCWRLLPQVTQEGLVRPVQFNSLGAIAGHMSNEKRLSCHQPSRKMKKLNWKKLPNHPLTAGSSLWLSGELDLPEPDFSAIEEFFSQVEPPSKKSSTPVNKVEPQEISFLDSQKSLRLNIFLKQFKCSNDEIIEMIRRGDKEKLDEEKLKQLLKLLPEEDEIEMLKSVDEGKKLGNAESFYQHLITLPSYTVRLEALLLCSEANSILAKLRPQVDSILLACCDLLNSTRLQRFCMLVLEVGNFLNFGNYMGGASGFHVSTLSKLKQVRGNKPGVSLLHFLIMESKDKYADLLKLPDDLLSISKAANCDIGVITSEAARLHKRIEDMRKATVSDPDVEEQFSHDIEGFRNTSSKLHSTLSEIESKRLEIAAYICEDEGKFSLQECICNISSFSRDFIQAEQENKARAEHEARMARRREQEKAKMAQGQTDSDTTNGAGEKHSSHCMVDELLAKLKTGYKSNAKNRPRRGARVRQRPSQHGLVGRFAH